MLSIRACKCSTIRPQKMEFSTVEFSMPSDGTTYFKFSSLEYIMPSPGRDLVTSQIRVALHTAEIHYVKKSHLQDLATYKIRLHNIFESRAASRIFIGSPMALHIRKLRVHSDFEGMSSSLARWYDKS